MDPHLGPGPATRAANEHSPYNVFVLSAGGARGAAQVGMLRGLLGAGIVPHAFVGCSVGALNSAFMACGPTIDRVEGLAEQWTRLQSADIFTGTLLTMAANLLRRRPYLHETDGLQRLIREWAPVHRIEELPTRLRVVTTGLRAGAPVYHDSGVLRDVLLASTALPGMFPPVDLPAEGVGVPTPHVDGGVADMVPVAGALGLHPTHVYVLDATIPPQVERPRSPLDVLVASLGVAVRIRPGVAFDAGVAVTHIRSGELQQTGLTHFGFSRQLIRSGEEAAQDALARVGSVACSHSRTPWTRRPSAPGSPAWSASTRQARPGSPGPTGSPTGPTGSPTRSRPCWRPRAERRP